MMTSETTFDEIQTLIDWYYSLPEDFMGVNDLMLNRQKLSALSFNFATLTIQPLGKEWKANKANAHGEDYQTRVKYHEKGQAKARDIAKANTAELFKKELASESDYWSAMSILSTVENVLNAMNQHISHLKEEIKYSRYREMSSKG